MFYLDDILDEHETLRAQYGSSVLLTRWDRFGEQKPIAALPPSETIYVTLYDPGTFVTKDQATAWCDANFAYIADEAERRNVCLPREAVPPYT